MINMAVLNLKDIIKYFIKITIVIAVVVGLTKYFSSAKENATNKMQIIENINLTACLDSTIPGISSINKEDDELINLELNPLKDTLAMQISMLSALNTSTNTTVAQNDIENNGQDIDSENLASNENTNSTDTESNNQEYNTPAEHAETNLKTEVQPSNITNRYTTEYNGVQIRNETDYKLTSEILKPDITVNNKNILIYHTHTCESYTASEKYQYTQTGNYRTTDKNYSVVRVGRELKKQLTSYGYNVIHSETYHDYPSYTGSYNNSLKTATSLLEKNKNTDVVIDLHRDAIGDNTYAPTVKIGEEYAAQLMFVIGGNNNKNHEDWDKNLKFAIKVQEKANEMYPGLFKPIILRYAGYNQQVAKGACIIEVGATGNTLDQALTSMKYLAKVLSEVMKDT